MFIYCRYKCITACIAAKLIKTHRIRECRILYNISHFENIYESKLHVKLGVVLDGYEPELNLST